MTQVKAARSRSRATGWRVTRAVVVALLVAGSMGLPPAVIAAGTPTVLIVDVLPEAVVGTRVEVAVGLRDAAARPIADALVSLLVDGRDEVRRRTDAKGEAAFSLSSELGAGDHLLAITFSGDARHLPATVTKVIELKLPSLSVRTLPPIEGVVFEYAGRQFTSGVDGSATVVLSAPLPDSALPTIVSVPAAEGTRVEFAKWWGKTPELTVSFDVYYRVSVAFTDRLGNVVDPATIASVTIRSSVGQVIDVGDRDPFWVHGVRVVSLAGGLEVKDILYGVDEVEIQGTSVVNRAQQRFTPREDRAWNIEVLFYKTRIRLTDLVFGTPVAARIRVEYPSARVFYLDVDGTGVVELPPLPRGTYKITPQGAGITVTRPVTMSRDAEVDLTVISYLDVVLGVAIPAGIALLLLLIGRPQLLRLASPRRWLRRQRRA